MSTPMNSHAIRDAETKINALLDSIGAALPAGATVKLGGRDVTIADLTKRLDAYGIFFRKVHEIRTELEKAFQARERVLGEVGQFLAEIQANLVVLLGRESPDLGKFGFKPRRKPTPISVEKRLLATAKARATREARGTMGRRQKQEIVGETPEKVTVTRDGFASSSRITPALAPTNGGAPHAP